MLDLHVVIGFIIAAAESKGLAVATLLGMTALEAARQEIWNQNAPGTTVGRGYSFAGAIDQNRRIGIEFRKCVVRWRKEGLMDRYLSGQQILDIGFRGGDPEAVSVNECAIGAGLDYPGYDGNRLPFDDETQDAVFSCAVLEYIPLGSAFELAPAGKLADR